MVTVLPDCVERVLQRSTMSIALRRGCLRSSGAQCAAAPTRAMSLLRSEQAGGSKAINILLLRSKNQQYPDPGDEMEIIVYRKGSTKIERNCPVEDLPKLLNDQSVVIW